MECKSLNKYREQKEFFTENGLQQAEIAIVLGKGLNPLLNFVNIKQTIPYTEIPGLCASTVEFHKGNLVYGTIQDKMF